MGDIAFCCEFFLGIKYDLRGGMSGSSGRGGCVQVGAGIACDAEEWLWSCCVDGVVLGVMKSRSVCRWALRVLRRRNKEKIVNLSEWLGVYIRYTVLTRYIDEVIDSVMQNVRVGTVDFMDFTVYF